MSQPVVFVTLTAFTTVPAPGTITNLPSAFASVLSSSFISSLTSQNTEPATSISKPHSTGSSISAPSPTLTSPSKDQNDTFASMVIASIVLVAVLYLLMVGFAIFLWWQGRCPNCKDLETKVRKMESGSEVRITKEMVKDREKRQEEEANLQEIALKSVEENRAGALAALEANVGASNHDSNGHTSKGTFWPGLARMTGSIGSTKPTVTAKGKERAASPGPESGLENGSSIPYNPYGYTNPKPEYLHPVGYQPEAPPHTLTHHSSLRPPAPVYINSQPSLSPYDISHPQSHSRPRSLEDELSPNTTYSEVVPVMMERLRSNDSLVVQYRFAAAAATAKHDSKAGEWKFRAEQLLRQIRVAYGEDVEVVLHIRIILTWMVMLNLVAG